MTVNPLKAAFFVLLIVFQLHIARSQSIPLLNGFAHNDYLHKHPLYDALQNGYTNIEADIFLRSNNLVVAHINPYFKGRRQLENLYLKPLLDHINENGGQVYKGYASPVTLMIDIKTEANSTYKALKPLLEKYKSILTRYENGKVVMGAVTVVLSGHKPYDMIKGETSRLAFIDEDLRKAARDTSFANVFEMASCKYSNLLKWKGEGTISESEQQKLISYVAMAHRSGEKVRLWASPDNKAVWDELLKCGVDLINTDKLVQLKEFLIANELAAENTH
jgi:Glycerophosphoryl diester phosphodiesterase family